jgi:hypothetical protein
VFRTSRPIPAQRRSLGSLVVSAAGVAALAAGLPSLAAGAAAAQPAGDPLDCDAAVVDTGGAIDAGALRAAAAGVGQAEVVVRSFESVPGGDLDARVDEIVAACFAAGSGQPLGELALFAFSVDDRVAVVVLGPALPGGDLALELRETMTARFPEGDYTGGVLDAIDELSANLERAAGSGEGSGSLPAGESAGGDGGSQTPWLLGAAAVVAGGGAGGVALLARRRRLNEARTRLAEAAAEPRVRVGATRERGLRTEGQASLWSKTSAERTLEVLQGLRHQARSAGADTDRAAGLLVEATPQGIGSASFDELAVATKRLAELVAALDRNEQALDELSAYGARLDHLRVALPAKKELLQSELEEAQAMAQQRQNEGWKVDDPVVQLSRVGSELAAADLDDLALDLLGLSDRIEAAEALLLATGHDLQSLPDRPGAIAAWRAKLAEAAELEQRRIEQARRRLDEAASVHAPESWQWAAEHPDEAEQHLREAAELASEGAELARSEQRFDDAGRRLEEAGLQLIGADELLDQVEDLVIDLERALAEAAGMLVQSRQVLADFSRFVDSHRRELDRELVAKPHELDEALDGLDLELRRQRPNHLRVAQTADRINRELDELLVEAQEQHARVEALRRQASREVERAQRCLQRARQSVGWELFRSSDSEDVDYLEQRLASLPDDLEVRIDEAGDIADSAVAVQERVIARRRRHNTWVVVGSGSGGWGGDRSGSGGRTFGGGSGGLTFGGGGSGGRSFGGGRSSGSW